MAYIHQEKRAGLHNNTVAAFSPQLRLNSTNEIFFLPQRRACLTNLRYRKVLLTAGPLPFLLQ